MAEAATAVRSTGRSDDRSAVLALEGVDRSFGTKRVLRAVDLTVPAGAVIGVIGDNGAGKTTLLRVACGILRSDAGSVRLGGVDPVTDRRTALSGVGVLIEGSGHYDELSVRDNLRHYYGFYTEPETLDEAVSRSIHRFELTEVADQGAGSLSTGYRRRLAVARAAHPWARMVLLDEPFANLDPRARSQLKAQLRSLVADGVSILFSSHILSDVDELCDEIHVLVGGRLHRFESFDEIRLSVGGGEEMDLDTLYARLADRLESKDAEGGE